MICRSAKFLQNSNQLRNKIKASFKTATTTTKKWDLLTALCIERRPIITPELSELEKEYKQYLSELEFERSLKCNHEVQLEAEIKQLEALKTGSELDDLDINLKQTAQDLVDSYSEEHSHFKFASRVTDADKKSDVKSLNRKLDKHLVFVKKQKFGDQFYYLLPQCVREDGETLRQTAERLLKECCGSDVKAQIYGNAPCGFYKYNYSKVVQDSNGTVGAKVFFYFARYLKGNLLEKDIDFKWLDRQELIKTLPTQYGSSVSQFLFDE